MIFELPEHINSTGLVPFLGQLSSLRDSRNVAFDFSGLKRVSPAGLAAITAWTHHRKRQGHSTKAIGLEDCPITRYLQRMNLLALCGWDYEEENFQRRDEAKRFIPLEEIPVDTDELAARFAACIAPGGEDYEHPLAGLYDTAFYLITELANNVRQHSMGTGYLVAQTTQLDGFVRIAIADCGKGIPEVLRSSGLTANETLSDNESILRALEPKVSSRGQPTNEGVGLTLSARVTQLLGGAVMINSRKGIIICDKDDHRRGITSLGGAGFPGTLVTLVIPKADAHDFHTRLEAAKNQEGLLRFPGKTANFHA